MKLKVITLFVVSVALLSWIVIQFTKSDKKEPLLLSTDESAYLNWDSVCTEPWDRLIINQTGDRTFESAPNSVSFYDEKKLVQWIRIPETITFWMDKDEFVTILELQREQALFSYQGIQHLSSAYTYGIFETMTIGDGFFSKCYVYQEN